MSTPLDVIQISCDVVPCTMITPSHGKVNDGSQLYYNMHCFHIVKLIFRFHLKLSENTLLWMNWIILFLLGTQPDRRVLFLKTPCTSIWENWSGSQQEASLSPLTSIHDAGVYYTHCWRRKVLIKPHCYESWNPQWQQHPDYKIYWYNNGIML